MYLEEASADQTSFPRRLRRREGPLGRKMHSRRSGRPLVQLIGDIGVTLNAHKCCLQARLAVFYTPEAAAKAVSKWIGYYENRTRE